MHTENFMDNNHISPIESGNKDASSRVYGTPTIEELRMRVLERQLEKKKKGSRKKQLTEY